MRSTVFARLAGVASSCLVIGAASAAGTWTTSGPYGGSAPYVAQSRSSPATLYAAGRGGVFRSTNAADTWQRTEVGLPGNAFAVGLGAGDAQVVYLAANNQVFRSNDAALTWSATALSPAPGGYAGALSVHSTNRLAYAGGNGVYVSTDGGATWRGPGTAAGLAASNEYRAVWMGATRTYAGSTDFDGTLGGVVVYRTADDGTSWTALASLTTAGLFGVDVIRPQLGSETDVFVFGFGAGARSTGGGSGWLGLALPAGCSDVNDFAQRAVAEFWIACNNGVFTGSSSSGPWTASSTGLSVNGTGDVAEVNSLTFSNVVGSTRVWAGGDFAGVFRTEIIGPPWVEKNLGLESTNIRALATHPTDPAIVFAGYGDAFTTSPAIFRTDDDGLTWPRSNAGIEAEQIRAIAVDPAAPNVVYAVGRSETFPVPGDKDGGIYKSTNGGANWSTIDSGIATRDVDPSLMVTTNRADMGTVRSVVLDARSCIGAPGACTGPTQKLFVAGTGRFNFSTGVYAAARIYRSADAGTSWFASDAGLPGVVDLDPGAGISNASVAVVPLVIDPLDSQKLYAGTVLNYDSAFTPTIQNGIFRSVDGGVNWTHSSTGLPALAGTGSSHWDVLALAIAPNGTTLYAGASRATAIAPGTFDGRMFKSTNSGASWVEISTGIAGSDIRAILVDRSDLTGNTVYAATAGRDGANPGGVYKTTDGGANWDSISIGLPADAATALARDPTDPARIYAGTVAGVWELVQLPDADLDGISDASEAAGPGLDADGDNVLDEFDANTTVLITPVSFGGASLPAEAKGAVPPTFATIVALPQTGTSTCAQVNNAQTVATEALPALPLANANVAVQLRFELPICAEAFVDVTFSGANFADVGWAWFNYGPRVPGNAGTTGWYVFEGARKLDADTWRLTLDASAVGNYRSDGDTILFQGGPVFVTGEALFSNSFE